MLFKIPTKWKQVVSSLSDVLKENNLSDVTLVSDDQEPFHAHRYILSAFSPVLKNILLNHPHPHPLIYLKGVNQQELGSILQFMYLGEVSVHQSNMNRLAEAAEDLQITKLAINIAIAYLPTPTVNHDDRK